MNPTQKKSTDCTSPIIIELIVEIVQHQLNHNTNNNNQSSNIIKKEIKIKNLLSNIIKKEIKIKNLLSNIIKKEIKIKNSNDITEKTNKIIKIIEEDAEFSRKLGLKEHCLINLTPYELKSFFIKVKKILNVLNPEEWETVWFMYSNGYNENPSYTSNHDGTEIKYFPTPDKIEDKKKLCGELLEYIRTLPLKKICELRTILYASNKYNFPPHIKNTNIANLHAYHTHEFKKKEIREKNITEKRFENLHDYYTHEFTKEIFVDIYHNINDDDNYGSTLENYINQLGITIV